MISYNRINTRFKSAIILNVLVILIIMGCSFRTTKTQHRPFVIGVIADVQYADKEERNNRYYRTAISKLEESVAEFNKHGPDFVIQLGDIIDGHSNDMEQSTNDLDQVLTVFNRLTMPTYHVIGNHCMHAGEENLRRELDLEKFYYDFTLPAAKGWRFVVLDGNDAGYGIIGDEQYAWFESTLRKASKDGDKVIVFCHYALLKESANSHRMAKPEPLLMVMDESGVVAAWFAGHDHAGGYALREGVHHVTVHGMVEAPVNNAYALVELHPDMIRIVGFGDEPHRELNLN